MALVLCRTKCSKIFAWPPENDHLNCSLYAVQISIKDSLLLFWKNNKLLYIHYVLFIKYTIRAPNLFFKLQEFSLSTHFYVECDKNPHIATYPLSYYININFEHENHYSITIYTRIFTALYIKKKKLQDIKGTIYTSAVSSKVE